jgi:hypothetical protein
MATNPADVTKPLDTLTTLLTAARELVGNLTTDSLFRRVVEVFSMLPAADREPILKVLERDATWTRIVEGTKATTGISVRPNPHASLYIHVLDPVTGEPIEPGPSERDQNIMLIGLERFVCLFPLLFQEGVYAQWAPAARAIARAADADVRAAAARLAHEVLAMLAESDAADAKRD